jgi:hypothetical protein
MVISPKLSYQVIKNKAETSSNFNDEFAKHTKLVDDCEKRFKTKLEELAKLEKNESDAEKKEKKETQSPSDEKKESREKEQKKRDSFMRKFSRTFLSPKTSPTLATRSSHAPQPSESSEPKVEQGSRSAPLPRRNPGSSSAPLTSPSMDLKDHKDSSDESKSEELESKGPRPGGPRH